MRTNYDVLEEEGLLGRELTAQEIADDEMELALDEQGFFDDEIRAAMQTSMACYCNRVGGI